MLSQIVREKQMTAEEAANLIEHNEVLGTSGFTPAGYPKAIPLALAKRAEELHKQDIPFQVSVYTGASTGDELDGALTRAKALKKRVPYQSHPDMRKAINAGEIEFTDFHLSHLAQYLRYGFIDKCKTAIVEAVDLTNDGKIYLSMSGGMSATFLEAADRILIELNQSLPIDLKGLHDVFVPKSPPQRMPIRVFDPSDRIGAPFVRVPVEKICGVVVTNKPDVSHTFKEPDEKSRAIAGLVMDFLQHEQKVGRMPRFLPYQSGVGNVANAVLGCMANYPNIDPITLYTEVVQDSIFDIYDADRLNFASTAALTLSPEGQKRFFDEIETLKKLIVVRQQEMSNNPEIIRRLGIIAMNTALEMDIFGNVNSTHVMGSSIMNGIGGSGDFCRNAYISIFMAPSTAKRGDISAVVPMVSHVDHNEHSVQVLVTEKGLADLRGLCPVAKARKIIANCAHENYRDSLEDYLERGLREAPSKHTPHI
ncbi:MAG: succinate CoA transferase, partial [Planctomycetes bacterium]|nr:succinate CoA transferase [Planctomycetota bacterium]